MKIVFKNINNTDGEIKVEERIFTIPHANGKHYRQLLKFDETINYANLGVEEHDELVGFVCDVFQNQFTVDEFYEGIPAHETVGTLINVFAFVRTGKTPEELTAEQKDENEKNA
ncbi:phage tail assembly chaperone G [Niallia sp. FSL W8-1348]|uniref:phage tail assembly chaperone G n=1 Tax=Niallia sp. FSL W8-1348 TaxID=2954656 RepID=UPI0030FCB19B